ncbi:C40 family peptidase [Eisenibacter elegans]|jgi:cell wall-associated NlpC family hydrolase|uniref:C40 family peptidase n=1 Tax=Eisenibacter elegans TaxID=997 RepID=UPI00040CDFA4|nr:C40 family peptidase [Eisenibacter elegans]
MPLLFVEPLNIRLFGQNILARLFLYLGLWGLCGAIFPVSAQTYGLCEQSHIALRAQPGHQAERVTELLFGEAYLVLEANTDSSWLYIRTQADQYPGWIPSAQHSAITPQYYAEYSQVIHPVAAQDLQLPGQGWIPAGATLPFYQGTTIRLSNTTLNCPQPLPTQAQGTLLETAQRFLKIPYLWGGKTSQGLDCSGFVQVVHKIHGIALPRDSYQQAEVGQQHPFAQAKAGDLAFFQRQAEGKGKVVHVGIYLGNGKIIHADGQVRIDTLDTKGLYRQDQGRYSHYLKFLTRLKQ